MYVLLHTYAIQGSRGLIPAWYHTFVEIDHEIISTIILLSSADPFSVASKSLCTKYWLIAFPGKRCG